ncbi:hypothetical protein FJ364_05240, partial [Candidatus Dependentiae bacterium]|nr:hypothetical protein [Candidatus Dependentiae bacterium]
MNINQFDIIENITLSRALFTAAELNIAEYLETKPLALEELAFLTQTTPSTLKRLLYFLCLKNIFTHELDGTYSLPSHSQNLLQHHPASIKPFLLHDDESRWNCFGHLTYCIQSGKPAFDMLYGKDYFTSLKENPLLSKRFDEAINIISNQEDAAIAQQLSCHGVVADIGGGNGQLINKLITQTAVSSGILFDLP